MVMNKLPLSRLSPCYNRGHGRRHGTAIRHTKNADQSNVLQSYRETSSFSTGKTGNKPTYVTPASTATTTWNYTPTIRYGCRSKHRTTAAPKNGPAPKNDEHCRDHDDFVHQYQGYFDPSSKHLVPKDSMYQQSWV